MFYPISEMLFLQVKVHDDGKFNCNECQKCFDTNAKLEFHRRVEIIYYRIMMFEKNAHDTIQRNAENMIYTVSNSYSLLFLTGYSSVMVNLFGVAKR